MEWNQGKRDPRNKLRVGTTGNAGAGNPAINALLGGIGGVVGNHSIGEVKRVLEERGVLTEIPMPTHGYMRRDEFYSRALGDNLLNEWVSRTLRIMIYTERIGRCMSADTFLCNVQWEGQERIFACRWHMRYVR